MKKFFCLLAIAISVTVHGQELVSAPFATTATGVNISRQVVISFGAGYNFSRLYTAGNITVTGERNVPALLEARAGLIMGSNTYIVIYTGVAYQPSLRFSSDISKGELVKLPSHAGVAYGMFVTVPAPWEHMTFNCGVQMASLGNNISSAAFVGLKARLSKGSPCD
jgi:hypothetical protein